MSDFIIKEGDLLASGPAEPSQSYLWLVERVIHHPDPSKPGPYYTADLEGVSGKVREALIYTRANGWRKATPIQALRWRLRFE